MKSLHASNSVIIIALVAIIAVLFAGKPGANNNVPKASSRKTTDTAQDTPEPKVLENKQTEPATAGENSQTASKSKDEASKNADKPAEIANSNPPEEKEAELVSDKPKTAPVSRQAEFEDVSESGATGTIATSWDGSKFKIEILATLPAIPQKTYYQAWLTNHSGEKIKLGNLTQLGPRYSLGIDEDKDLSEYTIAKISFETKDDENLETIILQGNLR